MTAANTETKTHPTEAELADFLSNSLSGKEKERLEEHIAICGACLESIVSAHEAVKLFRKTAKPRKGIMKIIKKINIYLVLAAASFLLSFAIHRYFVQFLVATILLGIKWIVDSKSTRMLVMIYEAWKKGGEKEASRILNMLPKDRF